MVIATSAVPPPLCPPRDRGAVEALEGRMLAMPQAPYRHDHFFAPGVYVRQITMPAGTVFIGHEHKTEHLNVVLKGHAVVMMDGVRHDIRAGQIFASKAGVRKVLLILEETVWATVHPTPETDLDKLEGLLITKSTTWLEHHAREVGALQAEIIKGGSQ